MSTEKELVIRTRQRDWWMEERNRLLKRLINIVTENGKFPYGTTTRCLDVVEHVFASHRRICDRLQGVVQKHNLGDAGMPVDEIVCRELEKFMRFPPPIDNEFVADGCQKFGPAIALGRLGGRAGTGQSKARTTQQARAAAKARWDKYRAAKPSERKTA